MLVWKRCTQSDINGHHISWGGSRRKYVSSPICHSSTLVHVDTSIRVMVVMVGVIVIAVIVLSGMTWKGGERVKCSWDVPSVFWVKREKEGSGWDAFHVFEVFLALQWQELLIKLQEKKLLKGRRYEKRTSLWCIASLSLASPCIVATPLSSLSSL